MQMIPKVNKLAKLKKKKKPNN